MGAVLGIASAAQVCIETKTVLKLWKKWQDVIFLILSTNTYCALHLIIQLSRFARYFLSFFFIYFYVFSFYFNIAIDYVCVKKFGKSSIYLEQWKNQYFISILEIILCVIPDESFRLKTITINLFPSLTFYRFICCNCFFSWLAVVRVLLVHCAVQRVHHVEIQRQHD